MKKLLIPILFLLFVFPAMSQGLVSISGTIADSVTGNPIPNHAVTISNDSTGGWVYYYTTYTNNTGFYVDTVPVPAGSQGILYVRTSDCMNNMHQALLNYNPASMTFTVNFQICGTPSPGLPILSTGSATGITNTSAILHGFVNPNGSQTNVNFEFGTSTNYGTFISCGPFSGNTLQPVTQTLTNLLPGTQYHYRITGNNNYGIANGFDSTFITLPLDSLPVVITNGATGITNNGATMHGLYNPNGHSCTIGIEWGLTTSYGGFSSTGGGSGFNYIMDQATIYAFPPNTVVHYRAFLVYSGGTINGADSTFTTLGTVGCQAAFAAYPDSNVMYSYQFWNLSTGNNVSTYIWSFGDGTSQTVTFPGSPNVNHTYSQPGIYLACLTIKSNDSSCFDITCDTIVVGNVPACQAAFTYYTDSLNSGNTYHFIDQSVGNVTSWHWNFDDPASGTNSTSNLQNPTHVFILPGTYNVCLTIYGPNNCSDIICHTVIVNTVPGCQANYSYSVNPGPGNNIVTFTDLSTGNPTAWFWSFGDGTSGNVQNPVHTYTAPGTYNVCLTITGNNCQSVFCQNVVIFDSTNYHQVYGQVFAGNFPVTAGLAMIFSVDTSGNYQPYVDVSPLDSNGVYYFTMVPDGNYYIMAIPFDSASFLPTYYGNVLTWQQATIISLGVANNPYNINLLPSAPFTSGPGSANGQINMGDVMSTLMMDKVSMILLNAQGVAIGFTGVSSSGAFDFSTLAYGTYYLHAEIPGITSDYVMITLTPEKPHADVNMTFTGNSILGIKEELSIVNSWNAYPNPVNDKVSINIDIKQTCKAYAEIYDLTGHKMISKEITLQSGSNKIEIPTALFQAGIYTLRIYSESGMNISAKLVKIN